MEIPPTKSTQIADLEAAEISEKKTAIHKKFLENIEHDPIAVDELFRWCHVSAVIVNSFLLESGLVVQSQWLVGNLG